MSVLCESDYAFVLDWRACLADEVDRIATALGKLGVVAEIKSSDDGQTASVAIGGKSIELSCSPNDQQKSWLAVISGLQSIVPANIEFRESVENGVSDTDVYAVLPCDEWKELDTAAAEAMRSLFRPLRSTDR